MQRDEIRVTIPTDDIFELWFRRGSRDFWPHQRRVAEGPLQDYETLLEAYLQEGTLANAQRWSQKAHADSEVMLSLFTEDCPHPNPENNPKYDGVEFFQHRVLNARRPWTWKSAWLKPDPYTVAFMEAAATQHPLVAEFEVAMSEWDDAHGRVCELSPQGTICRACAEAHEEWDEDGMEPAGCRLEDDVREAYDEFWYANGERA